MGRRLLRRRPRRPVPVGLQLSLERLVLSHRIFGLRQAGILVSFHGLLVLVEQGEGGLGLFFVHVLVNVKGRGRLGALGRKDLRPVQVLRLDLVRQKRRRSRWLLVLTSLGLGG